MKERSRVPALEKGLRIIETLAGAYEPMTLTQIAGTTGFGVSQIQRTLEYLVEDSYLLKNETGAYYLSGKLYLSVMQKPPQRYLLNRALAAMEHFSQETGESIHIGVLIGSQVNFVGQVEGSGIARLTVRLGSYPAHKTTSGRLLLSYSDSHDFEGLELSVDERSKLEHELLKIRKNGYAFSKSQYAGGVYDLAVPVYLANANPIGALATTFLPDRSGTTLRERIRSYRDRLKECARQITVKYGTQSDRAS